LGTTYFTNLIVNGTQTNIGTLTVLGGGNVLTNGATATLNLSAGSTVAPPTATNHPVDYATFQSALVGNFVSFFTTNAVTAFTNSVTPTNLTYQSSPTLQTSAGSVSVQATNVGQYMVAWMATNRTITQLQGGMCEVELWMNENTTPGSLTLKPELYLYDTVLSNLVEFGENVASQTVAAGATSGKHMFSVSYSPVVTNNPCYLVVRLKVMSLANTPTVVFGIGGATPSHFSIAVPNTSLTAADSLMLGGIAAGSWLRATNTPSAGQMLYATDTSPTNLYFGPAPAGGGLDLAGTNYFRNAVNLTNLPSAGIVTNNQVTVTFGTLCVTQLVWVSPSGAYTNWMYFNGTGIVSTILP
jgi:hypothetical protein